MPLRPMARRVERDRNRKLALWAAIVRRSERISPARDESRARRVLYGRRDRVERI